MGTLRFGHLGNGITVWDKSREVNNDYLTVAWIRPNREVKFYHPISKEGKKEIERFAREENPTISATQDTPVFNQ